MTQHERFEASLVLRDAAAGICDTTIPFCREKGLAYKILQVVSLAHPNHELDIVQLAWGLHKPTDEEVGPTGAEKAGLWATLEDKHVSVQIALYAPNTVLDTDKWSLDISWEEHAASVQVYETWDEDGVCLEEEEC